MALTSTLGPVGTLTFRDNNGKRASMRFNFPATVNTLALATTRLTALRDAIVPLSNAQLVGASVAFPYDEDASPAPGPESEVERKLIAGFLGENNRQTFDTEVPSAVFDLEINGTDTIDAQDARIVAFVAAVFANATTNRGETLSRINPNAFYIDHRDRKPAA